jgi:hypothetical protein
MTGQGERRVDDRNYNLLKEMDGKLDRVVSAVDAHEVKITDLWGNGRPGRVTKLEEEVEGHGKKFYLAAGILTLLGGAAHIIFDKLAAAVK